MFKLFFVKLLSTFFGDDYLNLYIRNYEKQHLKLDFRYKKNT